MYSVQGYKCVSYGIIIFSFQKSKVCQLTSSVFCSSLCLFRRNNYKFSVVSLGACGISYTKKNHYNFASLSCKQNSRISVPKLVYELLRDYFGGKFMAIRCFSDAVVQVLLIGSKPIQVLSIRSDPIRSGFCKPAKWSLIGG